MGRTKLEDVTKLTVQTINNLISRLENKKDKSITDPKVTFTKDQELRLQELINERSKRNDQRNKERSGNPTQANEVGEVMTTANRTSRKIILNPPVDTRSSGRIPASTIFQLGKAQDREAQAERQHRRPTTSASSSRISKSISKQRHQ